MLQQTSKKEQVDYSKQWMFSKEVADYLGFDDRYFNEKFIFATPGFPKAIRLTESGRRRWLRSEIDAWIATRREAA